MYTLKSIVRRGTPLAAIVAIVAASVMPATSVFADALNPLTKRSLTLSSSSPGWAYTDGSGNTTYAPPNSGANGQKAGNTFSFHNSTPNGSVKAMSFQYCTSSAGECTAPGNDTGTPRTDDSSHSDLNVVTNSPAEVSSTDFGTVLSDSSDSTNANGDVSAVPGATNALNPSDTSGQYAAKNVAGNFVVYYNNAGTWTQSTGWHMTATNVEDGSGTLTGKNNYITLVNDGAGLSVPSDTAIKVVFFGTNNNYITNPGAGAFFVKINTYNDFTDNVGADTTAFTDDDAYTVDAADIVDGGVTVANVMNQSIQITTKVLETMSFSVGTVDPNTLDATNGDATTQSDYEKAIGQAADNNATSYIPCQSIATALDPANDPQNVLKLGDQTAESALSDQHTFITHSYWRLSSNSSAGATVYYSGHTLTNTEGDAIAPIGPNKAAPTVGAEQFGLALANGTSAPYTADYSQEATYENGVDNGHTTVLADAVLLPGGTSPNASYHTPQLAPLVPKADYSDGSGTINGGSGTKFAFDSTSDTIPVPLADESSQVVDCVTGKMRYIANIAATTPAGIYTTKVNYIAAPQY